MLWLKALGHPPATPGWSNSLHQGMLPGAGSGIRKKRDREGSEEGKLSCGEMERDLYCYLLGSSAS